MHMGGANVVEIAAELCHLKTTVYVILKRFESQKTLEVQESSSRPQICQKCSCIHAKKN